MTAKDICSAGCNSGHERKYQRLRQVHALAEFDPSTEKSKLYAYPIDSRMYASGKTGMQNSVTWYRLAMASSS